MCLQRVTWIDSEAMQKQQLAASALGAAGYQPNTECTGISPHLLVLVLKW